MTIDQRILDNYEQQRRELLNYIRKIQEEKRQLLCKISILEGRLTESEDEVVDLRIKNELIKL